jgi:transcriptional regulator with XRE-family HTH domain
MKQFDYVGEVVATARKSRDISQTQLSKMLGYKSGQFVSNVERGLCAIPYKKLPLVSNKLKVSLEILVNAYMKDFRQGLIREVKAHTVQAGMELEENGIVVEVTDGQPSY